MLDKHLPLKLMKNGCERLGINFLIHYGIRDFHYNGNGFGINTNEDWNKFIDQELLTNTVVREHYLQYLKILNEKRARYQIRRKEDANTKLLNHLVEAGMSNSLTIYSKYNKGVRTYFFVADPNDREANCYFYNNLHLFEKVIALVEKQLNESPYWNDIILNNQKLFSHYDTKLIFHDISLSDKPSSIVYLNGKVIKFTKMELKILGHLKPDYTVKSLSRTVGLSTSGVNFHLTNIRDKLDEEHKSDLVGFITKIQNLI